MEELNFCILDNHSHLLLQQRMPHRQEGLDVPLEVTLARKERAAARGTPRDARC